MEFLSKLWFSAQVMIIGILIVFVGLAILIGFINLLTLVLSIGKKKEAPKAEAAPVVVPAPVAEEAAAETDATPDELIAVITAALMAYAGSNKTLVVRNIRAAAKAPAWARAGRVDQMNGRF